MGGGRKSLLPFSFTGNPAASIAHNMRECWKMLVYFLYRQQGQ